MGEMHRERHGESARPSMSSPGEPLSQHFPMFSKPETLYTEVWWGVEKVPTF